MPTLNVSDVADWLRTYLASVTDQIDSLYLFGSVTRGATDPSDCDVLILTPAEPDSDRRKALRSRLRTAEIDFLAKFGVPLSAILLGVREYHSLKWFKRKGREKTLVKIALVPAPKAR